jgi:hypothetical protein
MRTDRRVVTEKVERGREQRRRSGAGGGWRDGCGAGTAGVNVRFGEV